MKMQMVGFILGLLVTFGGLTTYIDAKYYDKEDVDFKFNEIKVGLTAIKRIQCALIKIEDKILWEAECQK